MAPESTHTTDHRHFCSGNLTLKDYTAIYKENRSFFVNNNKITNLILTHCVNDNFSRNLTSSEKKCFAHDF